MIGSGTPVEATPVEAGTAGEAEAMARGSESLVLGLKAPWRPRCGPRRGVVERVQAKFRDRVRFACPDLAADEGAAEAFPVRALPTLALFRDGKEVERLTGFTPAPRLASSLDLLLGRSDPADPSGRAQSEALAPPDRKRGSQPCP